MVPAFFLGDRGFEPRSRYFLFAFPTRGFQISLFFGGPGKNILPFSRVVVPLFSLDAFEHIGFHRSESRFQLAIVALRR